MTIPFRAWPILAGAVLGLAAGRAALAAESPAIELGVGEATVLHLDRAAKHVVLGNPAIADVTVQDARTLVVFGRQPGGTSLVVMDAGGAALIQASVVVGTAGPGAVSVTWANGKDIKPGGITTTYACGGATCVRSGGGADANSASSSSSSAAAAASPAPHQ